MAIRDSLLPTTFLKIARSLSSTGNSFLSPFFCFSRWNIVFKGTADFWIFGFLVSLKFSKVELERGISCPMDKYFGKISNWISGDEVCLSSRKSTFEKKISGEIRILEIS